MLCNRTKETKAATHNITKETAEIEEQSKLIMNQYANMLNSSSVAFKKEVTII